MGTAANPLAQFLQAAMLRKAMAGGGASPMGPQGGPAMGPSGAPSATTPAGQQFASQMSELQGADPGMILNQLKQIRTVFARMLPFTIERLPGVATNVASLLRPLDGAIKEAEKAQQTLSTLTPPRPAPGAAQIGHSAVNTPTGGGMNGAPNPQ